MSAYNFTIDDASPVITYTGTWLDANSSDPSVQSYANSTFHSTSEANSAAHLTFDGTAIYVYGSKQPTHDQYTVTLDGHSTTLDGFANPARFQQLLFSSTGLANTQHTISIKDASTIASRPSLDIDFITITIGNGRKGTVVVNTTVDDQSTTNITYGAGWANGSNSLIQPNYFDKTFHNTSQTNSSVILSFYGNSIFVYGGTSKKHGAYSISVDDAAPQLFNGSAPNFRAQQLLYFGTALGLKNHTLSLTNIDSNGLFVDLDYFTAASWIVPPSAAASSPSHGSISTGAIVGVVIGAIAVLLLALGGLLFWLRRRKRRRRAFTLEKEAIDTVPYLPDSEPVVNRSVSMMQPQSSPARPPAGRDDKSLPLDAPFTEGHYDSELPPPGYDQILQVRRTQAALQGVASATRVNLDASDSDSTSNTDTVESTVEKEKQRPVLLHVADA